MQKQANFKTYLPYLLAVIAFIAMSVIYVHPVLEGKMLKQPDVNHYKGMSQEVQKFREQTGEEALWTNRMFGGMPAYQISVKNKNNIAVPLLKVLTLNLPRPANMIFLYFIGFFILMMVLQRNVWIGIFGAVAFALSSYFIIILEAGHNTKALAIGLMPPLFAGIHLLFRKKYLTGFLLTAVFTALQLRANHLQITYYLLLILLAYGISELIYHVKMKDFKPLFKSVGLMLAALIIAIGVNAVNFWMVYESGQHSTRGTPVLSLNKENQSEGLDPSYIMAWSYGKDETLTLLVPDLMGGASQKKLTKDSETYKALIDHRVPPAQAVKYIADGMPVYWGKQPFTSGPVYVGALIVFLFVFGFFIVDNRYRWWILAITLLAIMLSWGKNFEALSQFFIHYIPGYNKFRAVSMILVIVEFTMPLMAVLALVRMYQKKVNKQQIIKALKYATGIVGGLLLILLLGGVEMFSFAGMRDAQMVEGGQLPQWLMEAIRQDRIRIMRSDTFRSLVIVLLGAGVLWLWVKEKLKAQYALIILMVVTLFDMWLVDKRYLNEDNFVSKHEVENPYSPLQADLQIMQDPDPNFRVFSQLNDPFSDARTSYFHKSIGGYHGAKLQRYQDVIEYHLSKGNMSVFNMLNAKYFIAAGQNKQPMAQRNPGALGHAWFVNDYSIVENPDSAILALNNFKPAQEAIVEKQHAEPLEGKSFNADTSATIRLQKYQPNHLTYEVSTQKEQLAVFSEIYYPEGWHAYIDGKEAEHFRVNYILRGMIIPAGNHKVEFEFKPEAYYTGRTIAGISSGILVLLIVGGLFVLFRQNHKQNQQQARITKSEGGGQ